jgi:hypothetical protein
MAMINDMFWALLTDDERYRVVAGSQIANLDSMREAAREAYGRNPSADELVAMLFAVLSLTNARVALLEHAAGVSWDEDKLHAAIEAARAKKAGETT